MTFDSDAERLRAFVEEHGRLPKSNENDNADPPAPHLGGWLKRRRADFKRDKLHQDHTDVLRDIVKEVAPNDFVTSPPSEALDTNPSPPTKALTPLSPTVDVDMANYVRTLACVVERLSEIVERVGEHADRPLQKRPRVELDDASERLRSFLVAYERLL